MYNFNLKQACNDPGKLTIVVTVKATNAQFPSFITRDRYCDNCVVSDPQK